MNNQQTDYKAECLKIYYASDVCDKKLNFGCLFRLQNQNDDGWVFEIIREPHKDRVIAYEVGKRSVSIIPLSNIRVIGHPPTLANWLHLISKNHNTFGGFVKDNSSEWVINCGPQLGAITFNLTTEEPTDWESLYNIIKT